MEIVRRQHLLIVFLLALLINLMLLLPFLLPMFKPPLNMDEQKKPLDMILQPPEEQAALKPKEALVLPDYQPTLPQPKPQPEIPEQPEQEAAAEEPTPREAPTNQHAEPIPEHLPYSDLPGLVEQTKEIEETKPDKKMSETDQKSTEKKKVRRLPRVISPPQNRPMLPNFNQNFAQYMKEGEDDFKRKGNENLRPDLEEMKLLSYNKKMIQFLNGACGQLRGKINGVLRSSRPRRDLSLGFSIGANGQLLETEVLQSSGSAEIDELFREIFRTAAPFPDIPTHLNGKYTQRCVVNKEIMDSAKSIETSFFFRMYD